MTNGRAAVVGGSAAKAVAGRAAGRSDSAESSSGRAAVARV